MATIREIFPRPAKERRQLVNTPSRKSDRREHTRYEGEFDVTISLGTGAAKRTFHARATNVSNGGILLQNVDVPATESELELNFRLPQGAMPEGYEARFNLAAKMLRHDAERKTTSLKFLRPLEETLRRRRWLAYTITATILIALTLALIAVIKQESVFYFWFDVPIFLYGLCTATYLVSRFAFAGLYSPYSAGSEDDTPSVSIVIPCFNEEEWIERTVRQSLDQTYPEDRLQVIVVNDGSTDSSHAVLEGIREQYRSLVYVNLTENVGKRKALAVGIEIAKGDLVVFVDSDSFLRPDAIRNIVRPFSDPRIAGVSGHCDVENKWTNFLTRMQTVRYYVGFRVLKAAESIFDSVTCLSGPLSCYRKEVLLTFVDRWTKQQFLGQPATFGDDRSLTNFLLPHHKVVYQSDALCETIVPSSYKMFFRQQMRWKRSWLRESLRASGFMWRKQPFMAASFYLGFILPLLAPIVTLRAIVLVPLLYSGSPIMYLFGILLMSSLMSSVYLFHKRSPLWIYGIPFCFFYMFVLLWQLPIAALTIRKSRWGTRGIP